MHKFSPRCARIYLHRSDNLGGSRLGHSSNHFDLMMAAAIAWHLRKYARVNEPINEAGEYQQPDYERSSLGRPICL